LTVLKRLTNATTGNQPVDEKLEHSQKRQRVSSHSGSFLYSC